MVCCHLHRQACCVWHCRVGTETSPTPVTFEFPSSQASCCCGEGIRQADGGMKEPGQNQRCKTSVWDCPVGCCWALIHHLPQTLPARRCRPAVAHLNPRSPLRKPPGASKPQKSTDPPPKKKPCSNPSPALHPAPGWAAGAVASPGGTRALAWVLEQTELCVMVPCIRHIVLLLLSPRCGTGAAHPG